MSEWCSAVASCCKLQDRLTTAGKLDSHRAVADGCIQCIPCIAMIAFDFYKSGTFPFTVIVATGFCLCLSRQAVDVAEIGPVSAQHYVLWAPGGKKTKQIASDWLEHDICVRRLIRLTSRSLGRSKRKLIVFRTHTRTYTRTYVRTHAHTHARTHARTHTHTHTHTHTIFCIYSAGNGLAISN